MAYSFLSIDPFRAKTKVPFRGQTPLESERFVPKTQLTAVIRDSFPKMTAFRKTKTKKRQEPARVPVGPVLADRPRTKSGTGSNKPWARGQRQGACRRER